VQPNTPTTSSEPAETSAKQFPPPPIATSKLHEESPLDVVQIAETMSAGPAAVCCARVPATGLGTKRVAISSALVLPRNLTTEREVRLPIGLCGHEADGGGPRRCRADLEGSMAYLITHFYEGGTAEQYQVVLDAAHSAGGLLPGRPAMRQDPLRADG